MWSIINILFLAIGLALVFCGWKAGQRSEAYEAFVPFFGGIIIIAGVALSAAIKAISLF